MVRGPITPSAPTPTLRCRALTVVRPKAPFWTAPTQRWVGAVQNGAFGRTTVKALQRRVGVGADGVIGPRTMRALQVRINAHRDGARYPVSYTHLRAHE